ncbi:hypothetical protein KAH37_08645 [bacterium]|nr:hypothetical protein [bacterium]
MSDRIKRDESRHLLKQLDQNISEYGYEFSSAFYSLWKSVKMLGVENDAVMTNVTRLMGVVKKLGESSPTISFGYNGIDVAVNGQRLKGKRTGADYLSMLTQLFTSMYIGEFIFPGEIEQGELINLCLVTTSVTLGNEGSEDTYKRLLAEMTEKCPSVMLSMYEEVEEELPPIIDPAQMARQVYRTLVEEYDEFTSKLNERRSFNLKKAIRAIQNIVDLLTDTSEESQFHHLMTLASLNAYKQNYFGTHATNTAILSMAAGIHLKMSRNVLVPLGLAGYFHDIAITEEDMDNNDWKQHTERGFILMSRLNSLNLPMMESALANALHHKNYDSFGEDLGDSRQGGMATTPLLELVKIADYFDTATRWWQGKKNQPISRAKAIKVIFDRVAQKQFAPAAARAFLASVGLYPHGSLLKLRGEPFFAFSTGGFMSNYQPVGTVVLDDLLKPIDKRDLYPAQLTDVEPTRDLRVPPSTIAMILNDFKIV